MKRKSRKGIKTTIVVPEWQKKFHTWSKKAKRGAWDLLGLIGLVAVAIWLFRLIAGGG